MNKKRIKIQISENVHVSMLFGLNTNIEVLMLVIKDNIKNAIEFFEYKKPLEFSIELIYSRTEFDKRVGSKTENWVTAHSFGDHFIIFDPSCFEKHTCHNKKEFGQIIAHETAHILLKQINPHFGTWINEGVAQFVAGQKQNAKILPESTNYFVKNCLFKNSNYNKFIINQGYEISYRLVKNTVREKGKNQLFKLLLVKFCDEQGTKNELCKFCNTTESKIVDKINKILILK